MDAGAIAMSNITRCGRCRYPFAAGDESGFDDHYGEVCMACDRELDERTVYPDGSLIGRG